MSDNAMYVVIAIVVGITISSMWDDYMNREK